MSENYNINVMRPAFVKAREAGNRRQISASFCKDIGISGVYFGSYIEDVKKLYEATSAYCRMKNSPVVNDGDLDKAFKAVLDQWQKFTTAAEATEFSRELRITEHDVSNLVGFCQGFMNMKNNTEFADKFVSEKAWAMVPQEKFQKYLETDLGIRIDGVEVLTDEERDFLTAENTYIRQIQSGSAEIAEARKTIARLSAVYDKSQSDEMKTYLVGQIKILTDAVSEAEKSIADAQTSLDAMHNEDVEVELPETEEDSEEVQE